MGVGAAFGHTYDLLFREFPHRAKTGLVPIGNPKRDSPVLLTGNYTETVRRMKKTLKGENVWLLISNSKGINVWCAAGGGHLTHHDVISSIVTSGVGDRTDNHTLILPQLGATGIERQKITDSTGWKTIWGPARLEDLPVFLKQGHLATPKQRFMRFPLWERMEIANMLGIPMILVGFLFFALLGGWRVGLSVGVTAAVIAYGIFALLPRLTIYGARGWITFSMFALFAIFLSWLILYFLNAFSSKNLLLTGVGTIIEMAAVSSDLAGTTPWYGSYINTFRNHAHIDLVEDRCNGSGDCIQVCPRDVFRMNGSKKKVDIEKPRNCIECGACIVQCPRDALRFRYDDGRVAEASVLRKTRMNMLGKRTIPVTDGGLTSTKEEAQ